MVGWKLSAQDLTGAVLSSANLENADLSHANLTDASVYSANLAKANLSRANLTGAGFRNATLEGANLSEAIVTGMSFPIDLTESQLRSTASYPAKNGKSIGMRLSPGIRATRIIAAGLPTARSAFFCFPPINKRTAFERPPFFVTLHNSSPGQPA